MDKCPICNKDLILWYTLGGKIIKGCPNIMCKYRGEEQNVK